MMRQAGMNNAEAGSGMHQENEDSGRSTQGHCSDLQDRCLSGTENCGIRKGPGLVHIYFGDGKGKSTAAAGLSIRMAGQGKPVVYARFLKSDDSGEVPVLMGVKEIELIPCEKTFGFTWQMGEGEKEEARRYYGEMFEKACQKACLRAENGKEDPGALLVLDEICAAVNGGFVEESALPKMKSVA